MRLNNKGISKAIIIVVIVIIVGLTAAGAYFYLQSDNNRTGNNATTNATQTNSSLTNQASEPERYIGDDFTIIPPEDWLYANIPGTLIAFQNKEEVYPEGSPAAKINFRSYIAVSFDNVQGRTLENISSFLQQETLKAIPSTKFLSLIDETVNGQPAKFLEAELTQQDVDYKVLMAIVLKGDKYFLISSNTTAERWFEYQDLFYNTSRSFKFKYGATDDSTAEDSGNDAPYIIVSDPNPNTKYFMLELKNSKFNYDRIKVNTGDSFKISLTENGGSVDFVFEGYDVFSTNGVYSTTITTTEVGSVIIKCKDRDCGQVEFVIE